MPGDGRSEADWLLVAMGAMGSETGKKGLRSDQSDRQHATKTARRRNDPVEQRPRTVWTGGGQNALVQVRGREVFRTYDDKGAGELAIELSYRKVGIHSY